MTKTNCIDAKNNFGQIVGTSVTTPIAITAAIPADNTVPQQTEGTEILTATITPKNANNILEIKIFVNYTKINTEVATIALFQDATANALAAAAFGRQYNNCAYMAHYMTAGTTSATTFKVRVGLDVGTSGLHVNADDSGNRFFGGASQTSIVIFEYTT